LIGLDMASHGFIVRASRRRSHQKNLLPELGWKDVQV
jgi:hypothetical protein